MVEKVQRIGQRRGEQRAKINAGKMDGQSPRVLSPAPVRAFPHYLNAWEGLFFNWFQKYR